MGYSVEPAVVQSMVEFNFQSCINSGLGLMHRQSYNFEYFEGWLKLAGDPQPPP